MKVKFHRFAYSRTFRAPADLARYADKQAERFAELEDASPRDYQLWGSIAKRNWANLASGVRGSEDAEQIANRLKSAPVFPFDSEISRTAARMVSDHRDVAAQELFPFLIGTIEKNVQRPNGAQLAAYAEWAALIAVSERDKPGSRYNSFDELLKDYEARILEMLEADRKDIEERRAEFSKLLDGARDRHAELEKHAAADAENRKQEWSATHAEFRDQLTTETAVELGSNRAGDHKLRYGEFRKWALLFGGFGIAILLSWIFGGFALARWAFAEDTAAQLASYTGGSIAFLPSTCGGSECLSVR